jgi:predicted enzyme related to lactoylglutathione lyase
MGGSRFYRYELRTTDVSAARAFYPDVLGSELWDSGVTVSPLPERAAALGAPAHWLGHIGVPDVEGAAGRIVAAGGQQRGPTQRGPESHAVLRDPFGAVIAVSDGQVPPGRPPVVWRYLHTEDHERAFAWYAGLFGWTATELLDLGPEIGRHQGFSWDHSGQSAGSITNAARLPHIHTQWLFCFRVSDMEGALARTRGRGGTVLEPQQTASGDLVAACGDPQGAAFALYQSRASSTL